jgi:hypothetical protein
MYQDCQIESWEEEQVNLHLELANCQFAIIVCPEWDLVAQVVFRAEMVADLVSHICIGLAE